jgi:toxin-antitoxin system PIN domain toxin
MIHLLDVNVLIALSDADHPHHAAALHFFKHRAVQEGWATCPLTENAFLRIQGRSGTGRTAGSTGEARRILASLLAAPGHTFWSDALSLMDDSLFPALPVSAALTDLYLLALAVKNGGRLATFDTGMNPSLISGGQQALYFIPSV